MIIKGGGGADQKAKLLKRYDVAHVCAPSCADSNRTETSPPTKSVRTSQARMEAMCLPDKWGNVRHCCSI